MLFRFSVKGQLLLVSLILCYFNLLFTLVIAYLKPLSGSSESLANAPDKIYGHMFKKCVLFVYLHIYLLELCFTLCTIFIGAKHFIIHLRLTEPIECLNTLN